MTANFVTSLDNYSVWLTAVVAGLIAFAWISRRTWNGARRLRALFIRIDRVLDLAEHELQPNSGSALYDKITRIDKNGHALWAAMDDLNDRLDSRSFLQAEGHHAMRSASEPEPRS